MDNRFVYADNSATTPVAPFVLEAMLPYYKEAYGNPSSVYSKGREAKRAVENAREKTARALGAEPGEIFFTSCGSESDNWAIKGAAMAGAEKGKRHIVTTVFEHHAVTHTCEALKEQGFEITYLPVTSDGLLDPEDVRRAIRPDTALVSIMYANNEIGTVLPIEEIGQICRSAGVLFHTDAVQAVGNVAIDVHAQHIDMLTLSAHKFHGPKGVGALYIRKGVRIGAFVDGGGQERGKRAGTENVAGIVALGVAIEHAVNHLEEHNAKKCAMTERLIDGVFSTISHCRLNGSRTRRLPGLVNFSFEGIEGESLLLMLDMKGVCASSGSACTSGSLDPSHVLLAIGLPHEIAHGSLRLSFSAENSMEDIDYILKVLPPIIERLRSMSPVWEKIVAAEKTA